MACTFVLTLDCDEGKRAYGLARTVHHRGTKPVVSGWLDVGDSLHTIPVKGCTLESHVTYLDGHTL